MRLDERIAKAFMGFLKRKNIALSKDGKTLGEADLAALLKEFIDARSKE